MSNELSILSTNLSMDSQEIARITGSRHDSVKRTIKRLAYQGVIKLPPTDVVPTATKPVIRYIFDSPRDTYIVAAQISPQHIADIVDAWGRTKSTLDELLSALDAFDIPEDLAPEMYVYAIRERHTGHIKLGISRDPKQRLAQLQVGNSQPLDIVAVRRAENGFADEMKAHSDAANYHLRGEWFSSNAIGVMQ